MREQGFQRVVYIAFTDHKFSIADEDRQIKNLGMEYLQIPVDWNKPLANEVAAAGITANVLLPGRIHTERVDQIDAANAKKAGKTVEEIAEATKATIPMGRYGTVEEFASVGAFLVSERARYVTGSVIRCDGGLIRSI